MVPTGGAGPVGSDDIGPSVLREGPTWEAPTSRVQGAGVSRVLPPSRPREHPNPRTGQTPQSTSQRPRGGGTKPDSAGSCPTHSTRHAPWDANKPVTPSKRRRGQSSRQAAFLAAIGSNSNSPTVRAADQPTTCPRRPCPPRRAPVSDVHRCAAPCGGPRGALTFQYSFPP